LSLYLTNEFGVSDEAAGWAYGIYGVMSTVFGVLGGWVIDYCGVRRSLLLGATLGLVARLALAMATTKVHTFIVLYTILPLSDSLGIPVLTIGIQRYTNDSNRTLAFSLFYSFMNIAALIAGPAVDSLRIFLKDGTDVFGVHFSSLKLVILSGAGAAALMLAVVMVGVREIEVGEDGEVVEFRPVQNSPWMETRRVLQSRTFWRLVLFTLLLIGVRMVFRHMDATLPKYMTRTFGEDAPFGLIYAINPFLIIFLVPIIGALTQDVDNFKMILYGSFVSGASPFWICLGDHYWTVIMFMVTLSLGEAVYSPRVYEYTLQLSEKGKEGLYSSLASAPIYAVKFFVGGISGHLLGKYCPETGTRNGAALWGIVGIMSFSSPILMTIFRNVINPGPEELYAPPPGAMALPHDVSEDAEDPLRAVAVPDDGKASEAEDEVESLVPPV